MKQAPTPETPVAPAAKPPRRIGRYVLAVILTLGLIDAASTRDLPRETLIAKYATGPSRFLVLPGGARVHYREQGAANGPVLVLLHGSNSSLHTWEPWVALLSDTFRIVTFDLPGHGLTGPVPGEDYSPDGMVKFVEAVRAKLGLKHFYLAGNSMGGHVAWRYTIAHPKQVDKLVLVDASGLNHLLPDAQQPKIPLGFRIMRTPVLNRIVEVVTPHDIVEKSTRAVFIDQGKVTPAMIDRYYDLLLFPGNRRATRLRAGAKVDLSTVDRLGEIKVPSLILSGQRDVLVPVQAARLLHERIAGSTLIEYPNVNHIPMEEIPERSAADVRAFLR